MEIEDEEEKIDEGKEEKKLMLNFNDNSEITNINNSYISKIKSLLEFIISQNNINKEYKNSLFKIRGFDPNLIFNEIDTISSGFINDKDIEDYLSNNNIKIEQEIINLFIKQFNKEGKDKNLYKKDFFEFINLGVLNPETKSYKINDYNKDEIDKNFLNLIKSEFELIKSQNKLIKEIIQIKEFSTYEAFNIISLDKIYIDLTSLKYFFGNKFQAQEIKELIHRIDLNNDKKISYEEFQDLFFPFQSHLHLDSEEEKKEIENENLFQNKYHINSDIYDNFILSSPNIIDKNKQNLNDNEIKININKNSNNKINDFNEIMFEEKKEFSDKDLKIKYDEKLINELNENNDIIYANNKETFYKLKLKCENEKIKISNIINDFNINDNENNNLESLNEKKEEKDNLPLKQINNISNINENHNKMISKSEIILPSNTYDINNFSVNKKIKIENLPETDKNIILLFIDYIHTIILLENLSENIKESIALCNDISSLDIYNIFNKDKDGLITKNNFLKVCQNKFYIYPKEKQIKLLFDRYDLDNDGFLNFYEFIKIISPLKEEYLLINKEENKMKNTKEISFDAKKLVIELFKRIIENESLIYEMKMKLNKDKSFNFVFLWGIMMKFSQDGRILNKNEFNNFLESFQCFLTKYELDIIFYKFSMGNNEIKYDYLFKEIITYDY